MTTTDRHEPAALRGLEAPTTATAGVTGTPVPHSDQAIHDHYDQAHALGYLRGYADGRDDGRLVGLDAAREAVAALPSWNYTYGGNPPMVEGPPRYGAWIVKAKALVAIDALREEQK